MKTPMEQTLFPELHAALMRIQQQADGLLEDLAAASSVSPSLEQNLALMGQILQGVPNQTVRRLSLPNGRKSALVFLDGMVDSQLLERGMGTLFQTGVTETHPLESFFPSHGLKQVSRIRDVVQAVLAGNVVVFQEGDGQALCLSLQQWKQRAVSDPATNRSIRGPRDGFIEDLYPNLIRLQRRLQTPDLKNVTFHIGTETHTTVMLLHLEGVASPDLVAEATKRLQSLNTHSAQSGHIDGILESGYVEELIEDHHFSLFPQFQSTERPDAVAGALLEGRIAILTDTTPVALIAPVSLWSFLITSDDYYHRFPQAWALRWLRFLSALVGATLPAVYISVINYHQGLMPWRLLINVAASRSTVPLPSVVEVFALSLMFDVVREATLWMPSNLGQALTIVGTLVIGQASVQAGFFSAPAVILVSGAAIATLAVPSVSLSVPLRILNYFLLLCSSLLGLYGLMIGLLIVVVHLCSLRSLGHPYLDPLAPFRLRGLQDLIVRLPHWAIRRRPPGLATNNRKRLGKRLNLREL